MNSYFWQPPVHYSRAETLEDMKAEIDRDIDALRMIRHFEHEGSEKWKQIDREIDDLLLKKDMVGRVPESES